MSFIYLNFGFFSSLTKQIGEDVCANCFVMFVVA